MKPITLLLSLFFLIGCDTKPDQQKIEGQVFILLRGGETLKLSLVPIRLVDKQRYVARLNEHTAIIDAKLSEIRKQVDAAEKDFQSVKSEMETLAVQLGTTRADFQNANSKATEVTKNLKASWSKFSPQQREVASQTAKDLNAKADEFQRTLALQNFEYEKLKYKMEQMAGDRSELGKKLERVKTTPPLFDDLPIVKSVISDADGKFHLDVPPGQYVIFAESGREVGDKREKYEWVVPVKENPVLLNNANITFKPSLSLSKSN
jgi:hypothetical protein